MDWLLIKNRAAYLAKQTGWNSAVPQPDWNELCHRAWDDLANDTEWWQEEYAFRSAAGVATYQLAGVEPDRPWITIKDCILTDAPNFMDKSSEVEERWRDPLWLARPAAVPLRYMMSTPNTLRLYPAPNCISNFLVYGTRVPPRMLSDAEVPPFPPTYHEALCLRAAVLYIEPWYQVQPDQINLLDKYSKQYEGYVAQFKDYLSHERYRTLQRRKRRPERRRCFLRISGRTF